jgi:ribosomal-protein-alanine N-acetyltransferase
MSNPGFGHPSAPPPGTRLYGKRLMLRPLTPADFAQWSEVRVRNEPWLTPWEPARIGAGSVSDPTRSREAFSARCAARDRERQAGVAYGFGVFIDNAFAGEVNLNNVVRGAMQTATVGYWIDRDRAGHSYIAEGVAVVFRHCFDDLHLHRVEICIIPRNTNSRRVMEKLQIREEGVAQRYLEINGVWEDHMRFGITVEEWQQRRAELMRTWIS